MAEKTLIAKLLLGDPKNSSVDGDHVVRAARPGIATGSALVEKVGQSLVNGFFHRDLLAGSGRVVGTARALDGVNIVVDQRCADPGGFGFGEVR